MEDIINELQQTEQAAEERIATAEQSAKERIATAVEKAEQGFDQLKADLEGDRQAKLKSAERQVVKEQQKITKEGEKQRAALKAVAKKRQRLLNDRVTKILFTE